MQALNHSKRSNAPNWLSVKLSTENGFDFNTSYVGEALALHYNHDLQNPVCPDLQHETCNEM